MPRSAALRRSLEARIRALPPGTPVVLRATGVGSSGRMRRFAETAGVVLGSDYFGIPSASPPTCYVEDAAESFRYFFSDILALPRGGLAASALVTTAKSLARWGSTRRLFRAAARSTVGIGRADARRMHAASVPPSLLEIDGSQRLVLALSKDPNAKVTVLLLADGSARPSLAVKVATTAGAQASIDTERRALIDVRERLAGPVLETIPRLADHPAAPSGALVTSALLGTPMTGRYHSWMHLADRDAVETDFAMAGRWLAKFQHPPSQDRHPIDIGDTDVLIRRFGQDADFARTMDRVGSLRATLERGTTPPTPVHGDFWFGNLLVQGSDVSGVVDWEAGSASGEPVRDLARFGLSYALYLDRHTRQGRSVRGHPGLKAGEWGAGIAYAIDGEGWFPNVFREFIRSGLRRLGADPELWRAVALAGLVDVAATGDEIDFARAHWRLFDRLSA